MKCEAYINPETKIALDGEALAGLRSRKKLRKGIRGIIIISITTLVLLPLISAFGGMFDGKEIINSKNTDTQIDVRTAE